MKAIPDADPGWLSVFVRIFRKNSITEATFPHIDVDSPPVFLYTYSREKA